MDNFIFHWFQEDLVNRTPVLGYYKLVQTFKLISLADVAEYSEIRKCVTVNRIIVRSSAHTLKCLQKTSKEP